MTYQKAYIEHMEEKEYQAHLDNLGVPIEESSEPSEWVKFLISKNICHPNSEGNMPCDDGRYCCKCDAEYIQADYEKWIEQRKSTL